MFRDEPAASVPSRSRRPQLRDENGIRTGAGPATLHDQKVHGREVSLSTEAVLETRFVYDVLGQKQAKTTTTFDASRLPISDVVARFAGPPHRLNRRRCGSDAFVFYEKMRRIGLGRGFFFRVQPVDAMNCSIAASAPRDRAPKTCRCNAAHVAGCDCNREPVPLTPNEPTLEPLTPGPS